MPIKKINILRLSSLLLIFIIVILSGFALRHYGPVFFDAPLLLWFRLDADSTQLAGPHWLTGFWSALSWSGNTLPRISIALAVIVGLLLLHHRHSALFFCGVLLSGVTFTVLLKLAIVRPRPQLVTHLDYFSSQSFPSGHTLNSTLFYLTTAWIIAALLPSRALRYFLYALAITLSLATGVSRVALGVHWPSDVLAGWVLATTWLTLWVMLVRVYWPKNQLEAKN
jgi:undecaprenyl-diphosphatase